MHAEWLSYLTNETKDNSKTSFNTPFLCSTEHLGLISVSGDDALSFLQNQFSNDIALIGNSDCQLNSYSNHKGRMYSIFHVIKVSDDYLIIVPKSQIEFLLQRLQMFVIMAKVTLSDVSDHWAKMGFLSSDVAKENIESDKQVSTSDDSIFIRINPDNMDRVLVLSNIESAQKTWGNLKANIPVSTTDSWLLADINEGIPSLRPETSEAFVLQMSNLQLLNGVNFKKGCFPGQEIVARTRYLGKAKRRMYLARVESSRQPLPAEELCELSSTDSDGSGKVVLSAPVDENNYDFLFVGNIKKAEANALKLVKDPDAKMIIKKLPYSFEE